MNETNTCRKLVRPKLETAGWDDASEKVVSTAKDALQTAVKTTSHNKLLEVLKDISRRPEPDSTGAIQHSMAALKCVTKNITGQPNATLGQILSGHTTVVPKPVDQAVDEVWGFASDKARHVREGQTLYRRDDHLVVGLTATLVNYLVHKAGSSF